MQRRRQMPPRSPLIFWLLLVATVCVDVVAATVASMTDRAEYSLALYFGLAFGQLSTVVAWCVFKFRRIGLWWLLPYLGCFLAALFVMPDHELRTWNDMSIAYAILFSLYVTLLYVLLWMIKQSHFVSITVDAAGLKPWQVSMKHLLTVTAVIAVLSAAVTRSKLMTGEAMLMITPWVINHLCVSVVAVLSQRLVRHVFRRVVLTIAAALISGIAMLFTFSLTSSSPNERGLFLAMNIIHALILLLWLDLGGIIPGNSEPLTERPATQTPNSQNPTTS
jgi:hypothetical protein